MEETIAAISTPLGDGGLAIVRVSGPLALTVADRLFVSRRGQPSSFPTHTIHLGNVGRDGATVDLVMLTVLRAPKTYTGEDTIEINCHGGILTARQILALCLQRDKQQHAENPDQFTWLLE